MKPRPHGRRAVALVVLVGLLSVSGVARAQSIGEVFRKASPSVVVIRALGRDVSATGETRFAETGSGVLISSSGQVMTAAHVVHAMDEVTVEFMGEQVRAQVVSSAPGADLSLLQLDRVPPAARPARLADSDSVQVGDQVIVVGAPYGLSHALSVGWISARWAPNTVYRAMPLAEFFQTDAAVNTGNSGGPMFNMAGDVIGIVSHNVSKGGGSEGLGFVVTANTARTLLLERRSLWTGLDGQMLTEELADLLNLPPGTLGYMVKVAAKGSPAEAMGIRGGRTPATIGGQPVVLGGDIVIGVLGIPLRGGPDLAKIRAALNRTPPGQSYTVTVFRAGRVLELTGRAP